MATRRAGCYAHRDTPPVDLVRRGRSPGSRVDTSARLPEAIDLSDLSGLGSPLTVAGAAPASSPASLLAPLRLTASENHRQLDIRRREDSCQGRYKQIFMSLSDIVVGPFSAKPANVGLRPFLRARAIRPAFLPTLNDELSQVPTCQLAGVDSDHSGSNIFDILEVSIAEAITPVTASGNARTRMNRTAGRPARLVCSTSR